MTMTRIIDSEMKRKILEVFVTSATDPIYAVKSSLPPEIFGAFGSYFSRNPKDFREHLWGAITGQIQDQETGIPETELRWLAESQFREPFEAVQKGLKDSRAFFKKWYGKYSHKSIANVVWLPLVATNVSQLFARELAYEQLAFFIEQSTRFVKFDPTNMYHDPRIMASPHAERYNKTLEVLAGEYNHLSEVAERYYMERIPFQDWILHQSSEIQNSTEKEQKITYSREIKGAALDVARFLLPQAIKTNIAFILDARSAELDIAAWKLHPLDELVRAAELIEKHAGQLAPSLLKYTEPNPYYGDKLNGYGGALTAEDPNPFTKGVKVISHEHDALNKAMAHLLRKHNLGGTFTQRYEEAKKMTFEEKIRILHRITENRREHDEWVETDEDFDLIRIGLEIKSDIGAIRDLRRHQKWDRGEPRYTLDNGYHTPPMLAQMGTEIPARFERAMELAHETEREIRRDFPFEAQYILPMATNHSIVFSGGLDQLQYLLRTRSTNQGNFSYRGDAFNAAEAVTRVYPWILGYEAYPEGQLFKEVYEKAPLKGILRLDMRPTSLHK